MNEMFKVTLFKRKFILFGPYIYAKKCDSFSPTVLEITSDISEACSWTMTSNGVMKMEDEFMFSPWTVDAVFLTNDEVAESALSQKA